MALNRGSDVILDCIYINAFNSHNTAERRDYDYPCFTDDETELRRRSDSPKVTQLISTRAWV